MTATRDESLQPPAGSHASTGAHSRSARFVHQACPFLVAADGDWRAAQATRDHRCGATLPMAAPSMLKQRDLCLTAGHEACATYVAAHGLELASAGSRHPDAGSGFWPDARSTVVALEVSRSRFAGLPGASGRHGGQALLVGLMVLAFLVLVIARTTPPSSGDTPPSLAAGLAGGASPAATRSEPDGSGAVATPGATSPLAPSPVQASPTAGAEASATPVPTRSPTATARPTATPVPANAVRYKVKSGDTLSAIAARYGTTVKKLKAANGLTNNTIHAGQVLVIP